MCAVEAENEKDDDYHRIGLINSRRLTKRIPKPSSLIGSR